MYVGKKNITPIKKQRAVTKQSLLDKPVEPDREPEPLQMSPEPDCDLTAN